MGWGGGGVSSASLDTLLGSTRGGFAERGASGWGEVVPVAANRLMVDGGVGADPAWTTLSALLDAVLGSTRGAIIERGASGWTLTTPVAANRVYVDGGVGADPAWTTLSALLDTVIGSTRGMLLARGSSSWQSLAVGAVNQVLSANANDPEWVSYLPAAINELRLTLTSGMPVTTSDVTGATTIYLSPYVGNRIALYDGTSKWTVLKTAEVSLALGTLTNGLPYDIFAYNNAGTVTLELLAWTNGTTRATALVQTDGVWTKTGATTRRYVGTFYTTATTTTEDSQSKRFLFNANNRVSRSLWYQDGTSSWTYTTATWRQTRGQAAAKVEFVIGLADGDEIATRVVAAFQNTSNNVTVQVGSGLDITGAPGPSGNWGEVNNVNPVVNIPQGAIALQTYQWPVIGYHYLAQLEWSSATGTTSWQGAVPQNNLQAEIKL